MLIPVLIHLISVAGIAALGWGTMHGMNMWVAIAGGVIILLTSFLAWTKTDTVLQFVGRNRLFELLALSGQLYVVQNQEGSIGIVLGDPDDNGEER